MRYIKDIRRMVLITAILMTAMMVQAQYVTYNHDNPAYFDGKHVNYKQWKAVPDYSVIKACGHTILCVGGAISVDPTWRIYENRIETGDGKLTPFVYWADERPIYDESILDGIAKNHAIDTVITHTVPSFCEKVDVGIDRV